MIARRQSPKRRLALWTESAPAQHARLRRTRPEFRRQIAAQTPATRRRNAEYLRRLRPWLARPENRLCRVWQVSEEYRTEMKAFYPRYCWPDLKLATQCHHRRGRRLTRLGDLLLLVSEWVPVSAAAHGWIDRNRARARELGLLAPVGQYDTWPK